MEAERLASIFSPYIRVGNQAIRPGTPHLTLQVTASRPDLSLTLPYPIKFVIRRSEDDGDDRPCIFYWSSHSAAMSPSGFVLLHHNAEGGVDTVDVDHSRVLNLSEADAIVVTGGNMSLWQLSPGGEVVCAAELPERYYRALKAGETYTLLYPGCEILLWDWGTLKEHLGREIRRRTPTTTTALPNPVIPGGQSVTFTAKQEDEPWPERAAYQAKNGFGFANLKELEWRLEMKRKREGSPLPMRESERVPGAPVVTVTLKCPPTVTGRENFDVQLTVTYHGVAGPNDATEQLVRPITFHTWVFEGLESPREGLRLDRRLEVDIGDDEDADCWEECDLDGGVMGYLMVDAPDVAVRVGEDKNFTSLMPGESWTTSRQLQSESWSSIPDDVAPGDEFRCRFKGVVVDWWDWGTMAEHADTVVKLPCFVAGEVTEPTDNGGRPKLVVPASEAVEFTYAG